MNRSARLCQQQNLPPSGRSIESDFSFFLPHSTFPSPSLPDPDPPSRATLNKQIPSRLLRASIFVLSLLNIASHAEETWWQAFGGVKVGNFRGGYHPNEDKPASKELEAFLKQTKFAEWETHEDDLVKLSYPKHPLLKLEIQGGKKGISVEGGVCSTVDNSYQKAYVLRAGEYTYGVFLVAPADWLDDGICMCGPMIHHAYQVKDGCLTRFSLLPGGAVKKAQILGGKLRLMAFEWTHLACPRNIYEELVERMTLKIKHPKPASELRQEVIKRYGLDGMAGFLAPGTSRAGAEELFHAIAREVNGSLVWSGVVGDYPSEVKAVFEKDVFVKFTGPVERTGEPAVKGSLSWISDRLEDGGGRGAAAENTIDLTKPDRKNPEKKSEYTADEKEEMVQALISIAEKNSDDWWQCLNLMQDMGQQWKTPARRFTRVILKHGQGEPTELKLLEEANYEGLTAWIEGHLQREINGQSKNAGNSLTEMYSDGSEKTTALLGYLARKEPQRAAAAAESLWSAEKRPFAFAVVKNLAGLEKQQAEALAKQALATATECSDPELLEELMDVVPELKLSNTDEFLKTIDAFNYPEREGVFLPENYWKDRKEKFRIALGKE